MKINYKRVPERFIEYLKEICGLLSYEIYRINYWEERGYSEVLVYKKSKPSMKDISILNSEMWKGSQKWELSVISERENELVHLPVDIKEKIKRFMGREVDYPSESRCIMRFYNSLEDIKISTITEIPRPLCILNET